MAHSEANNIPRQSVSRGGALESTVGSAALGIVVVNFFSHREVSTLLSSIAQLECVCDVRVCVVDNSCDANEWRRLQDALARFESSSHKVLAVRSPENLGFAAGNNLGFEALREFSPVGVIIVNPDVVLLTADLDTILSDITAKPSSIFYAQTESHGEVLSGLAAISTISGRSRELKKDESGSRTEFVYPSGHFMAMSSASWDAICGLSEDFFLFGEEADTLMRLRALDSNAALAQLEGVAVSHTGGLTSGAASDFRAKSNMTFRHATRSSVILFRKHAALRPRVPFVVIGRLGYALVAFATGGPLSAKAVLMGLADGLKWRAAT